MPSSAIFCQAVCHLLRHHHHPLPLNHHCSQWVGQGEGPFSSWAIICQLPSSAFYQQLTGRSSYSFWWTRSQRWITKALFLFPDSTGVNGKLKMSDVCRPEQIFVVRSWTSWTRSLLINLQRYQNENKWGKNFPLNALIMLIHMLFTWISNANLRRFGTNLTHFWP